MVFGKTILTKSCKNFSGNLVYIVRILTFSLAIVISAIIVADGGIAFKNLSTRFEAPGNFPIFQGGIRK
jgi:hypothetical protein